MSVCAHLHVLQHFSIYDLHQLCCSACSCQQLHLLLFCQAEQILESGKLSVLAAGNASSLPKLFPRLQAELRDRAPWFSLGFATGLLQWHWAPSPSLSFSNFSLPWFLQLNKHLCHRIRDSQLELHSGCFLVVGSSS